MSDSIRLLEHRIEVMQKEVNAIVNDMNGALNQIAETIQGIMKVNRHYQVSVHEQLKELRAHTNMPDPALEEEVK